MQNTRALGEISSPPSASASDTVYQSLKDEILSGEIESGELLTESTLAKRFGVSRTPVREAITLLEHDGLARVIPAVGPFVSNLRIKDVRDVFEPRLIVEADSAELAAETIIDQQLPHLESLHSGNVAGTSG